LDYFHFSYTTLDREKENIPVHGRLLIIANQPIGSLDGLALIKLVSEVRRDIKVVTSEAVMSIKPLQSILLPTTSKKQTPDPQNHHAIKKYLQNEGVVIMFPAGEVSRLKPNGIRDTRWQYDFLNLACDTKSAILPLYRLGQNKRPIFKTQSAIALPEDRKGLSQAIKQCEQLGVTADGKKIVLYQHTESSPILREIGRLREIAFRAVGEGSDKRRDIDQYDSHYYHLILWDSDELEIVGAYRLGDATKLTEANTKQLYSAALFNYDVDKMHPYFEQGLELGRSFVQPKYWGKRSLDYLWVGLGAFLKSRPQYRYLFGPVSISAALPDMAKDLLVHFYRLYFSADQSLAKAPMYRWFGTGRYTQAQGKTPQALYGRIKPNLAFVVTTKHFRGH